MAIPVIGSKWNGQPQIFIDTQNGSMWQSMPTMSDGDKFIQSLFVKPFTAKHYGDKPGEIVLRKKSPIAKFFSMFAGVL